MKERLGFLIGRIAGAYDKVIAVIAVLILLASSLLYWVNGSKIADDDAAHQQWLEDLRPKYPIAEPEDVRPYDEARARHAEPLQLSVADTERRVLMPELRYTCHACLRPRPADVEACPHCKEVQEIIPIPEDMDKDGMLNDWEEQYGFDKRDSKDAEFDADKDGFTNLEEHKAEPQTSPRDGADHPPILGKLQGVRFHPIPVRLKFDGANDLGGKNYIFQINDFRGDTHFVTNGQALDIKGVPGFKVAKYVQKYEDVVQHGMEIRKDVSELHLVRDGEPFVLRIDEHRRHFIYLVDMEFTIDQSVYEKLQKGRGFTLGDGSGHKGRRFLVIKIDKRANRVLIRDVKTSREAWIKMPSG